jgi:hypothetical protein
LSSYVADEACLVWRLQFEQSMTMSIKSFYSSGLESL